MTYQRETRYPLNLTDAKLMIQGTLPNGDSMELSIGKVVFVDADDAAIVETYDDPLFRVEQPVLVPRAEYHLELRGRLIADPEAEGQLYHVVVVKAGE